VEQHINKCRRWMPALAILLMLCASACTGSQEGGAQPDNTTVTPAGEQSVENPQGTKPAATPPVAATEVKGDSVTDANGKNVSKQSPFLVLIADGGRCCGNIKSAMDQLRKSGNPPLPFFIIDASKAEEARAAAIALNVGLSKRAQLLPWAGVFDAGAETDPLAEVAKVNDNDIQAATATLKGGVDKARGLMAQAGGPGQQEEAQTRTGGAETAAGGRQAAQPDFAKLLETHKAEINAIVNARVEEALQKKINAAEANAAKGPAAQKDSFQTYVDGRVDESLGRKTMVASVLAVLLMLAIAVGAWNFSQTRGVLKSQDDVKKKAEDLETRVADLKKNQDGLVSGDQLDEKLNGRLSKFVSASELNALRGQLEDMSREIRDENTGLLALDKRIKDAGSSRGETEVVIEGTNVGITTAVEWLGGKLTKISQDISGLQEDVSGLQTERLGPGGTLDEISQKVGGLETKLGELVTRQNTNSQNANVLNQRLMVVESTLKDLKPQVTGLQISALETSRALADGVAWLGSMEAARIASSGAGDEANKDKAIGSLEETAGHLHDSAERVALLAERMKRLVEAASERPQVSQELKDKLQGFLRDVEWFARQEEAVRRRAASLRGASVSSRYREFLGEQETLKDRFSKGELTASEFEAAYRESFNNHLSQSPPDGAPAADGELVLELPRVEDQLMDWFSNFSQLVSRVRGSTTAVFADADTVEEMNDVLNVAREVLIRFDIQPEEIEIGKTVFDPRIHQLVLARQSPYPAHTVVDVQQSGFRRVKDGETLRRPQVIVAQASGGEHA